ncbi:hypothetical protein SPHINGO391_440246 [Sphingomonas aurantiaca]|uniref:Uncharacterized protein n=1 Tax=Sphingomonas aurantiaca TaxID=185949 RepID=A0A5E7ZB89_9SPHN|nr:hypothetical protein SPHINGO391_440246 [Sphingomonas aurantiaca]
MIRPLIFREGLHITQSCMAVLRMAAACAGRDNVGHRPERRHRSSPSFKAARRGKGGAHGQGDRE